MSDLRIALVAEGKTDFVIIEAALKAILSGTPFILTLLQPEDTRTDFGGGWGGVFKWCWSLASGQGGGSTPETDPTLELFDLFIIHVDADVAGSSYAAISADTLVRDLASAGIALGNLPCAVACPPPENTIPHLQAVICSWFWGKTLGNKTVLCIPSKSSESWLAAGVYPDNTRLLRNLECADNMEGRLASSLPNAQRIKKRVVEYRKHAHQLTANWSTVCEHCSQAGIFQRDILNIMEAVHGS